MKVCVCVHVRVYECDINIRNGTMRGEGAGLGCVREEGEHLQGLLRLASLRWLSRLALYHLHDKIQPLNDEFYNIIQYNIISCNRI